MVAGVITVATVTSPWYSLTTAQSRMLTGVIRPCTPFGEGDSEHLANVIAVAESGNARFQMGDRRNLFDYVYMGNLVHGHVLLVNAVLRASSLQQVPKSERIDGEASLSMESLPMITHVLRTLTT